MSAPKFLSTGRCLPAKIVTNDDLSRTVDTNDEWVFSRTGIHARHFCERESGMDLARGAARQALERSGRFRAPGTFQDLHRMIQGYLGDGNKMGEGWLLTAEMLELIHTGTPNIVCTQPFGCLPNHIVGKGMLRKLKDDYPYSNVVALDYDPGATKINQENRIKLMLANAKALAKQQGGEAPAAAREAAPTPSSYTHAGAHA